MNFDELLSRQPQNVQVAVRLMEIFAPSNFAVRRERFKHGHQFAHYTSGEAALSIIENKSLWLRATTCMSDYREALHGHDLLNKYFADEAARHSFFSAVNDCVPGAAEEAFQRFSYWAPREFHDTYIASVSEHHKGDEDLYGRLSMWRAFGTGARVAIVFQVPMFTEVGSHLSFNFSPVAYLDQHGLRNELGLIIENIRRNQKLLRGLSREELAHIIFANLISCVFCTKHPGFKEEREWRVIHSPTRWKSDLVRPITKTFAGTPQSIYVLPLNANVDSKLSDIDFAKMFERLIIGPTQYGSAMYQTFVKALSAIGVEDAAEKVVISEIPIRT